MRAESRADSSLLPFLPDAFAEAPKAAAIPWILEVCTAQAEAKDGANLGPVDWLFGASADMKARGGEADEGVPSCS